MRTPVSAVVASSLDRSHDPSFDWARLAEVRDRGPRKPIVESISRGDDAERLVALGADAIVVSHHGGRQLDGASSSRAALPEDAFGGPQSTLVRTAEEPPA